MISEIIVLLTAGVGIAATGPGISNRNLGRSMATVGLLATPFLAKVENDLAREQGRGKPIKARCFNEIIIEGI